MVRTHRLLAAGVLAAAVSIAAPACASGGYYAYRERGAPEFERRAYDAGYRDGLSHGEHDARDRRDFRIDRDGDYRHADDGYHREYGDKEYYRRAFRRGYEAGYSEGFNRFARPGGAAVIVPPAVVYPNAPPAVAYPRVEGRIESIAARNGYRDGLEAGRDDRHDRNRFDPARAKRYREGDHDYDRRYGSRDEYRREYRAAFEQGYREGYGAVRY
jgi:hypothetical protein